MVPTRTYKHSGNRQNLAPETKKQPTDNFYEFENCWFFVLFLDKFWIFCKCLIVLICVTVLRIVNNFDNCTDNPGDLWHLRNSDNWEPEFMTIFVTWNFKSDTGQHSQFLLCFILHLHRPAISMCSTASTFPLISVFQIFFTLSHFLSYHPVVQQGCALYTARAQ